MALKKPASTELNSPPPSTELPVDQGVVRILNDLHKIVQKYEDISDVNYIMRSIENYNDQDNRENCEGQDLINKLRTEYNNRKKRRNFLPKSIPLRDPAWDILVDLAIAHLEGRRISVKSACASGMVPATTGLRWLSQLEREHLITRTPDFSDQRRQFVSITDTGLEALRRYFSAIT